MSKMRTALPLVTIAASGTVLGPVGVATRTSRSMITRNGFSPPPIPLTAENGTAPGSLGPNSNNFPTEQHGLVFRLRSRAHVAQHGAKRARFTVEVEII